MRSDLQIAKMNFMLWGLRLGEKPEHETISNDTVCTELTVTHPHTGITDISARFYDAITGNAVFQGFTAVLLAHDDNVRIEAPISDKGKVSWQSLKPMPYRITILT